MDFFCVFLGNYFGGEIIEMANVLLQSVNWSDAIKAADKPRIFPVVNSKTGEFSGTIYPYNEYYLVAYLANLTSSFNTKVKKFEILQQVLEQLKILFYRDHYRSQTTELLFQKMQNFTTN